MDSGGRDSLKYPAGTGVFALAARGYAWGETLILIPLHLFWVLSKSTPFAAENARGALLVAAPLATLAAVGLLAQVRAARSALLRLEPLLHWTAAATTAILLAYIALRDPFQPGVPITWPLGFWSACMAFALAANLATHLRLRRPGEGSGLSGSALVAVGLWAVLLGLAAGMTWAPWFWTASILFHAAMAARTNRDESPVDAPPPTAADRIESATAFIEGLAMATLLPAALLRFVFVCELSGPMEVRYPELVSLGAGPWFLAGTALALAGARFRLAFVSHAVPIAVLTFSGRDAAWPLSLVAGYALAALFAGARRQGALAWALTAAATATAWVVGLFAFTMAGLIVVFEFGLAFTQRLAGTTGVVAAALYGLWLLAAFLGYLRARHRPDAADATPDPCPARGGCALAYLAMWLLALAPAAVLLVTALWPPVRFERAPRIEVGSVSGLCHAGYTHTDEEYAVLHELGVRLVRIPFYWGALQPRADTWDFSSIDAFMDAADRNGIRVVAVIAFDNDKVEQSPEGARRNVFLAPEDFPLFQEYVRRTVDRYKDRVYAWEIWNEPDIPLFWGGTMTEFYGVARAAADAVREAHPDARLLGTAMTSMFGLYSAAGIEGLHAAGALDRVDHPTMHTYVSDPRAYYHEFLRVKNAAAKFGHPGAIWITEIGVPDGGMYPWCTTDEMAAEHTLKAYTIATALGIETVLWHCHKDMDLDTLRDKPLNSEGYFGLLDHEERWKPPAFAYRLFAEHCNDSALRADLVRVTGGLAARQTRTALYRRADGASALVLWFEPGLRRGARARVRLDLGALAEPATLHDIGSDYRKRLVHDVVDLTERPLFITFDAPDTDTPVRIAASASPTDAAWLLLLAMVVAGSGAAAVARARRA